MQCRKYVPQNNVLNDMLPNFIFGNGLSKELKEHTVQISLERPTLLEHFFNKIWLYLRDLLFNIKQKVEYLPDKELGEL